MKAPLVDAQEPKQNTPDNQTTQRQNEKKKTKTTNNQQKIIAHKH